MNIKTINDVAIVNSDEIVIKDTQSAIDFIMKTEDYKRLNQFRNKDFDNVEIDWYCKGGITIDQLANQFE